MERLKRDDFWKRIIISGIFLISAMSCVGLMFTTRAGAECVSAIDTGLGHSIVLKTDGTVWACGYNGRSQLGDGTNTDKNTPVQIIGQPLASTGLSVTGGDGIVNLDWDNITNFRIDGYNVYR